MPSEFKPVMEKKVDKYQPVYYAGASLDFNPIHIDPEIGKQASFNGVILHGLCTMAFVAEAATKIAGDPSEIKRIKCKFSRPVKPLDTLTFTYSADQTDEKKLTLNVTNQEAQLIIKNAVVELK